VEANPIVDERKSLKATRGGSYKWALAHLPDKRGPEFTELVAPLIREKAGASLNPWDNLKVGDVQEIVNQVFGKDKYQVTEAGPWYGLVREQYKSRSIRLLTGFGVYSTNQHLAERIRTKGYRNH
jgi:hypothetical protein